MGKTCVVQNFKSGIFSERQQNTIGVDFSVRTVDIEGKKVKVGARCDLDDTMCMCRTRKGRLGGVGVEVGSVENHKPPPLKLA